MACVLDQIQMEWHSDTLTRLTDSSVYVPAIIPDFPLTDWTDELTEGLVQEGAWSVWPLPRSSPI